MTPAEKFIAKVKESPGNRVIRDFVNRALPQGEVGMTTDMLHALWMKKLLDDRDRLVAMVEAVLPYLRDTAEDDWARTENPAKELLVELDRIAGEK